MPAALFALADLPIILRQLRRSRGFALTAVLTLALGVGANVIVFGVIDALLLRKLPVPSPQQLSFIQRPSANDFTLAFPVYRDLRERNRTFAEIGAYDLVPVGVTLHGQVEQRWATLATGSYFDLLGIKPFLGRFPDAADDACGVNASPFVVLTYDTWQHEFNADPAILGRKIFLSKAPFTILGVAPRGFYGTERVVRPTLWADLWNASQLIGEDQLDSRSSQWMLTLGRRKPGVTAAQAEADLNRIGHELAREYPKTDERDAFRLAEPGFLGNTLGPALHNFLAAVMLFAALVLAAACANLGGLYGARAADRRREIAIRMALGSSQARVTAHLLTESLLLSFAGGLLGCALARTVLHALTNYRPPFDFPIAVVVEPAWTVYAFALALSVAVGLLCGIVPAREARRTGLQDVLKTGALGSLAHGRRWTVRDALLLIEVALCCVLVTASAVSLRGLLRSHHLALGFHPEGVTLLAYNLNIAGYHAAESVQFSHTLAEQAARVPGVADVALASNTPLAIIGNDSERVYPAGTADFRPSHSVFSAQEYAVSPNFFRTAGTALLQGRDFTWADDPKAPRVAIVNQRFAAMLFPNRPAIGEFFSDGGKRPVQIVGIAEQGLYGSLNEDPQPILFFPIAQSPDMFTKLLLRVRPGAEAEQPRIANAVVALLHAQDPAVPVSSVLTWQAALAPVLFPARAATLALGVLGALALVLAATGIFGLASYTVVRRMREFGIRLALGAARRAILSAALGRVARIILAGSACGLALGLLSTRILAAVVYSAHANDPWVLLTAGLTMAMVGLLATAVPALHALRVELVTLLREE